MSESLDTLIEQIQQWGRDRKIIGNGTAEGQWLKLVSEFGEMADNVAKGQSIEDDIGDQFVVVCMIMGITGSDLDTFWHDHDSLSDTGLPHDLPLAICKTLPELQDFFYLMDDENTASQCALYVRHLECLAELAGTTLQHCVEVAYNEIKDRKGTLLENGVFVKEGS